MRTFGFFPLLAMSLSLCGCDRSAPEPDAPAIIQALPESTAPACELVMGWDPWEPYQYQVSNEGVLGLDIDLITTVLENAGCEASFVRGSWTELLSLLKTGEIDLLAGATRTANREKYAYFTDEYRDEEFYLYVRSERLDSFKDKKLDQLISEGIKFGVIEGYLYSEAVSTMQNNPETRGQFSYSSMSETNVSLLLEGKVDAIMEDKYVGAAIIRRKNLADDISPYVESCGRTGVRIMLSRASVEEEQFERISQSLRELIDNGQIQHVLDHYLEQ